MYTIEDHVVAICLKRGDEEEIKELDVVATYTAMQDLAAEDAELQGAPWLAKLAGFFQRILDVNQITATQAVQLQGVVQTEYEVWKKKQPLSQVWHLSTNSIPPELLQSSVQPSGPTCPDSEPSENCEPAA